MIMRNHTKFIIYVTAIIIIASIAAKNGLMGNTHGELFLLIFDLIGISTLLSLILAFTMTSKSYSMHRFKGICVSLIIYVTSFQLQLITEEIHHSNDFIIIKTGSLFILGHILGRIMLCCSPTEEFKE
ncbi:MAG: hypothetical protein GY804_14380 [Alphaproteobacteria bacterium]|nr:hypothetical protein [Alphaproteobacteria bacterium]